MATTVGSHRARDETPTLPEGAPSIEVRLLGSLEIQLGAEPAPGFSSQAARALLAYLASRPGRPASRDQLAAMLWPEEDERAARHNLRQAIYTLRTAFARAQAAESPLVTTHGTVSFEPNDSVWIDLAAFEEALRKSRAAGRSRDPNHLAAATQLYRGDFLSGFYLRGSPAFEQWLVGEQERLREEAASALRALVVHHKANGSYPLAIQYARQLLRLEPFSEETHRHLMQLYALCGQRTRALAHYEDLRRLLRRELGIAPLAETTELHRRIQDEPPPEPGGDAGPAQSSPEIPLVERQAELATLREIWASVLRGSGRLTLVEGEAGAGKTRLIRSFLDEATSSQPATILQGRCYEMAPPLPFQPIVEALRNALATDSEVVGRVLAAGSGRTLTALAPLVPELGALDVRLAPRRRPVEDGWRLDLISSLSHLFELLTERPTSGRQARPLILFLDDVHGSDASTCDVLDALLSKLGHLPVWILLAYRESDLPRRHRLRGLAETVGTRGGLSHLRVPRLSAEGLAQIATALVSREQSLDLARLIQRASDGLPLVATELVNLLWDEGYLKPLADGRLSLVASRPALAELERVDLHTLTLRRIRRLPRSARRLLALAAVAGPVFEGSLLESIEGEHQAVVEKGLELMVRHWLVRVFQRYWAENRRHRDVALHAEGARNQSFEFAHKIIRRAVYETLPPGRRQSLHCEIATLLEPGAGEEDSGTIAFHFACGGALERALPYLERAAERARRLGATETARHYFSEALRAAERLTKQGALKGGEAVERRARLIQALDSLE